VVANVDQNRHGVAAAGDGRAGGNVIGNPYSPGVAVTHVGNGADPLDIADADEEEADQGQGQEYEEGSGEDLSFQFDKFIMMSGHYLWSSPCPQFFCSLSLSPASCFFWFFRAMKQRVL